ncbi:MAG: PEP-CTERM sorting domain-containing protein [Fimbriimonadaceae bacterium]|nr:PEP-CTERM sorting domain-containing protein [Chthonomonadaceae bacterium]MCO5296121.1 PEP-CTERM sorting domain-containing protein [Fimbriimonadaceae bacterium]
MPSSSKILAFVGLASASMSVSAQLITTDRWLPPPLGVYTDQLPFGAPPINFGPAHQLLPGLQWSGFSNCILPPLVVTPLTTTTEMTGVFRDNSGSTPIDSFFDVFVEIDMMVGPVVSGPPEQIPIEIVALSLTSVQPIPLPPLVQIRENPVVPSFGNTTITPLGGGQFQVDSFFDVFFEVSLDGGQSWTPGDRPAHMVLNPAPVPEPATFALAGAALASALRRRRRRK